jgi:thiamine kinase-like enzyme
MLGLLDTLSTLHAEFWQSEKLLSEYSFMAPHTSGDLYRLFHDPALVPGLVASEIKNEQFKREMLANSGISLDRMYADYRKLQFHQATLPFTLCHGDTHIGNTYLTKDDRGGLIDWQLSARGYFMHDLSYGIITGLDVERRRAHESELIEYYLKQLRLKGVENPPSFDDAWLEYRRAATWCLYIGWLTTPVANYGWDITICNLVRLFAAYNDLNSAKALESLPEAPPFACAS